MRNYLEGLYHEEDSYVAVRENLTDEFIKERYQASTDFNSVTNAWLREEKGKQERRKINIPIPNVPGLSEKNMCRIM